VQCKQQFAARLFTQRHREHKTDALGEAEMRWAFERLEDSFVANLAKLALVPWRRGKRSWTKTLPRMRP
jgi:hypothetical protein